MTILKYLMSTGVCTTAELIALKKADPTGKDYQALAQMAEAEMKHKGIAIEEPSAK